MTGIYVTSIVPPEVGWPIAMHCPICCVTTFALDTYGIKPTDGDYFLMKDVCCHELLNARHNMAIALDNKMTTELMEYPHKSKFMFQPLNPMPLPYIGSWIEYTTEMPIEEAKKKWPEMFQDKDSTRTKP